MTAATTTTAATSWRRPRLFALLLPLLLAAAAAAVLPSSAAAAPAAPSTTTRLRGTVYSNVDATFERDDQQESRLPPPFPTPPHETGPVVVPCFVSRSHSTPYLEVVRHLAARGYRVVLVTDHRNAAWIRALYKEGAAGSDKNSSSNKAGPFELIVAPAETTDPSWRRLIDALEETIEGGRNGEGAGAKSLAKFIAVMGASQTKELFPWVRDTLAALKPSVVVCDLMQEWLADAGTLAGARLVMTTSGLFPGMADAPWSVPLTSNVPHATLEHAPFSDRVRAALLDPFEFVAAMLPVAKLLNEARSTVGLPPLQGSPNDRVAGRLHLVNTFFGHEIARPLPPHVRLIGPVRSDGNTTLSGEWRAFVDGLGSSGGGGDKKIVYLAFGQNCILSPPRLRGVLGALKRLLAEGAIDGAVWSLSLTPKEYLEQAGFFAAPDAVPPQIKLTDFAPQKALLASPATRVFVSHGGAESVGEGVFTATPMLVAPHFGDQSSNAYRLAAQGMALVVPKRGLADEERVASALRRLLSEPAFATQATRMRALALSRARLATESAADEVEYVLHYGDDHLQDPSARMGFVRRHNLDVKGLVLAGGALVGAAVFVVLRAAARLVLGAAGGGGGGACVGGVCKLPAAAAKKAN